MAMDIKKFTVDRSKYDDADTVKSKFKAAPGLTEELVRKISSRKNEPEWMLKKRLQGLELFSKTPIPSWGPDLSELNFDELIYYVDPDAKEATRWEDVPEEIRKTFDKLGIPEAEKKSLAGVGGQYDSSVVYHKLREDLEKKGVIFENMDTAVEKYPDLVKEYFMSSCIPVNDHKFIMLHAAVWSGGTFIYVPPNVNVELPLQAYFRMNAESGGQFEHTLIIVDKGAQLHYIEGCSSPRYNKNSLHAGCVELHVLEGARLRYSSIENWSKNTFNLNTKRAIVQKDGVIEWLNGNMGCLTGDSKVFTNPKGPVNIKDIEEGSKVFAWDEKTNTLKRAQVKAKMFSGIKKVYGVEAGGRKIEATANHPFLTLTRTKNKPEHKKAFFQFAWKPLEELKEGDVVGIAKRLPLEGQSYELPTVPKGYGTKSKNQYGTFNLNTAHLYSTEITIPKKTNEDFMWLMGILIGDGHVDNPSNKINIATHITDDRREVVLQMLKKLFNCEANNQNDRYIEVYSKQLCDLVTTLGFSGNADTKDIPVWVFGLPETEVLAFLAGYFDSDGHTATNALAITSINRDLIEKSKNLAIMCGFGVSRIIKHRAQGKVIILGKECNAEDSWRILLNGPRIKELPTRSKREQKKIALINSKRSYGKIEGLNFKSKTNDQIGFARIEKIVPLGEKPTYDIEVEGYHNFVSNGLILHNSHRTMLYPSSVLVGEGAQSHSLGVAFANAGQDQDTGAKVVHAASNTSSTIHAKSISKNGGISSYRGSVYVTKNAKNVKSSVKCDALLIDGQSVSNTYPFMKVDTNKVDLAHEASVGKIGEEEIFYLMSRGLSEERATQMVVAGFIEPVIKQLPLEYAVELNKLIELEMEESVG